MKGSTDVTDNDWFAFLSQQPGIDEVNFWQPGGTGQFRVLAPGEPFLFKPYAPRNAWTRSKRVKGTFVQSVRYCFLPV